LLPMYKKTAVSESTDTVINTAAILFNAFSILCGSIWMI
jgi:hypothetical protein